MMEAEKEAKEKTKRVIKVPKGTSEYQAAWIMDKPGMATQLNSVQNFLFNRFSLNSRIFQAFQLKGFSLKIKIFTSESLEKFQNFPIKMKVFLRKLKVSETL